MSSNISVVDPPTPTNGALLIFDIDSFSSSKLYAPGGSPSTPSFSWTSSEDAKHRVLHHGDKDGPIAGEITFHGTFKKGAGMVKIGPRAEIPIEEWGVASKHGVAVEIHGQRYVWSKRFDRDSEVATPKATYEAKLGDNVVATFSGSRADKHFSPYGMSQASFKGQQVVTRAHVTFAAEIDERTVPELMLSLAIFQYFDRKGSHGDYSFVPWATMGNICPVQ